MKRNLKKKEDFNFELPEELIAQDPLEDRSGSRLLVLDKESGKTEHHIFREIINYLDEGDCLVINDTKVIPARLIGSRIRTDAKIEVLLLKRKEGKAVSRKHLSNRGKRQRSERGSVSVTDF